MGGVGWVGDLHEDAVMIEKKMCDMILDSRWRRLWGGGGGGVGEDSRLRKM